MYCTSQRAVSKVALSTLYSVDSMRVSKLLKVILKADITHFFSVYEGICVEVEIKPISENFGIVNRKFCIVRIVRFGQFQRKRKQNICEIA